MPPGESGQLTFHLENGETVSERQLTRARSLLSLFPLDYEFNEELYQKVAEIKGKKVRAISFYYSGRIYTLTATNIEEKGFFIIKEKKGNNSIPKSQVLGLILKDLAIIKTISFADNSETTRIIRR